MQIMRWVALLTAAILLTACFYPWVTIESRNLVYSGFHSSTNEFGKPAVVHYFVTILCMLFLLINRNWSIRVAFFVSVLNIPWAIRNYFLIGGCQGGTCPQKQPALYVILLASVLLTVFIVLMSSKEKKTTGEALP
jgi:hypothetical protein